MLGQNLNGIAGIIDINGSPLIGVRVYVFGDESSISKVDTTGQGSGNYASSVSLIESGTLIFSGALQKDHYPVPQKLTNARGKIVLTYDLNGVTTTREEIIRIASVKFEQDQKDSQNWKVIGTAERIGPAVTKGFGGTQQAGAPLAPGNVYSYSGRNKVWDNNQLTDSSTQPFILWGLTADTDAAEVTAITTIISAYSTAPQTNEQVASAEVQRLSASVVRVVVTWKQRNSANDVNFPASSALVSAIQANRWSVSEIIPSSASDITEANTQFAIRQNQAYLLNLQLRSLTPTQKQLISNYVNPGIQVLGLSMGGGRLVPARISGGNLQLHVLETPDGNLKFGTGFRWLTFSKQWLVSSPIRRFLVTRMLTGTTIPEYATQMGMVNNASFLGLATGTCIYEGCSFSTNIALSGTYTFFVSYHFRSDANGVYDQVPESLFLSGRACATSSTATGWQNLSTLGLSGIIQAPTQTDFSVFIT